MEVISIESAKTQAKVNTKVDDEIMRALNDTIINTLEKGERVFSFDADQDHRVQWLLAIQLRAKGYIVREASDRIRGDYLDIFIP